MYSGNYKIVLEISSQTHTSSKDITFTIGENFNLSMTKVKGFSPQVDTSKLIGQVSNQSWISSKKLTKEALIAIVDKYPNFIIKGYDELNGILIEYDSNSTLVKENLESIKYKAGIDNVFNRVYEGDNAFQMHAIYPEDNGEFNDGGANWHLEAINMPEAWEYSQGNSDFLVGVSDGGFNTSHSDLSNRFAAILNYGYGGSSADHGMAVSGTIAANTDNGIGISGINWNANVVASYMGGQYVEDIIGTEIDGKEVELVSNSWGYHLPSDFNPNDATMANQRFLQMQSVYAQIRHMVDVRTDKLFLWAAGNGVGNGASTTGYYGVDAKYDNGSMHYKDSIFQKIDNLLVVGAFKKINDEYILTYYSNYGQSVDIAAPTEFDSLNSSNGIYTRFGGTSAATPVTSGVASLILSINPKLTPKQVKEILINSTTEFITKRYTNPYNYNTETLAKPLPMLNAQKALDMAKKTITPEEELSIDFSAQITDNFTPKVTFRYFAFEKGFKVTNISSVLQSGIDRANYTNDRGTSSNEDDNIEVSLDPNNRYHQITSTLTLTHILTGETRTQEHVEEFTYSDLTVNTIDANTSIPIADVDFTILSNTIFKSYKVDGQTDDSGTEKVYLPYNFYNIIGNKNGYKDAVTQEMMYLDQNYTVNLLFGSEGTTESGSISGTVYDINQNPLANATVTISNENQLIYTTETNDNGYYKFNNVNKSDINGTYITNFIMKATLDTYLPTSKENIMVLDGKNRTEHFTLIKVPENIKPFAVAGPDQVVNDGDTVTLDGSVSYDPDGTIESYQWKENNTILSSSVSFDKNNFSVGTHTISLIVTDNDGAISADYMEITVNENLSYNWFTYDWSNCVGDCGTNNGTQTRDVICVDSNDETANDSKCTTTKPSTIQSCTASQCAPEVEYYWYTGLWGDCQGECGITNGTQIRDVICKSDTNENVNDSYCESTKPTNSQNCSTDECSYEYGTITSYVTNRVWLDRNLGAKNKCETIDDTSCYGNYYQWGRASDGHEKTNSEKTSTVANFN